MLRVVGLLALLSLVSLSNKKGALRKRLPVLDGYDPNDVWEPPPLEECDPEDVLPTMLDSITRVTQRFRRRDGRLVDFAIILEVDREGVGWDEVAKIDCCHGQVHLHERRQRDDIDDIREVLRHVKDESDIQESVDDAISLIFDSYTEQIKRWNSGR